MVPVGCYDYIFEVSFMQLPLQFFVPTAYTVPIWTQSSEWKKNNLHIIVYSCLIFESNVIKHSQAPKKTLFVWIKKLLTCQFYQVFQIMNQPFLKVVYFYWNGAIGFLYCGESLRLVIWCLFFFIVFCVFLPYLQFLSIFSCPGTVYSNFNYLRSPCT